MTHKSERTRRKFSKDPNVYPRGWNRQRVEEIIKYYDRLKDQPVLDNPRVSRAAEMIWMEIPEDLVSDVQKLIERKKKSA